MDRTWTDPRDGKEWLVFFTSPGPVTQAVGPDYPSGGPPDPIIVFYHPRESLRTDRGGDEDLDAMTDQELMDLLDKAKKREGWAL
jgi:hypothetical protein